MTLLDSRDLPQAKKRDHFVRNVRRFRPWYVSTYLIKKWTSRLIWSCLGFFLIMIFFLGQFMITLWWNQYVHSRFFFFNDLILLISKVSLLLFITLCRLIWWYPVIDFKVQERKKIHEGLHRYFIYYWKIWLEKLIICGFFFSGDETSVKSNETMVENF